MSEKYRKCKKRRAIASIDRLFSSRVTFRIAVIVSQGRAFAGTEFRIGEFASEKVLLSIRGVRANHIYRSFRSFHILVMVSYVAIGNDVVIKLITRFERATSSLTKPISVTISHE